MTKINLLTLWIALWILFPWGNPASLASQPKGEASLGGKQITNEELVFGGSFSPPTLEHMGIVTNLMDRFGFTKSRLLPTVPYKKNAAPATVSLGLSKLAVENVDEVLQMNGLGFSQFSKGSGESKWMGADGRPHELLVDDFEIASGVKEDTLATLRYLSAQTGGPTKTFWISGGDSFSSVPSWTPQWRELFDHSNWIVISRPGLNDPKAVQFGKENPLAGLFPPDFLNHYVYFYDRTNQTHVYQNKNPEKPSIYLVSQPSLDDSSSLNRESLKQAGNHEHAQGGLQPSVFRECVEKKYYSNDGEVSTYQIFTRQNLEIYTKWLLNRIESKYASQMDPSALRDFDRFSKELAMIIRAEVDETSQLPWTITAWKWTMDFLADRLDDIKNLKDLGAMINKMADKYGAKGFAITYVALEVSEVAVVPPLMYYFAGAKGLALAPLIHPNEFITIPTFIIWNIYRRVQERKRLAGDLETYKLLKDYGNRQLRGDSEAIVARRSIQEALGLGGGALTLNIVKSKFPKLVPLGIRKWADRKTKWYDVNLSTNELLSILANSALAQELKESAQGDDELYAHMLLDSIFQDPIPRLTLELFATQRYYRMLAFGDVPSELLGGYTPEEQSIVTKIQTHTKDIKSRLNKSDIDQLSDVLGYAYALSRLTALNQGHSQNPDFWKIYLNLFATDYPSKAFNNKTSQDDSIKSKLLLDAVTAISPTLAAPLSRAQNKVTKENSKGLHYRLLRSAITEYVRLNSDLMSFTRGESSPDALPLLSMLPRSNRGEGLDSTNLTWDIDLLANSTVREWANLKQSYKRATLYLDSQTSSRKIEAIFRRGTVTLGNNVTQLSDELKKLKFEWLKIKYPYQFGPKAKDEKLIPEYQEYAQKFHSMRIEIQSNLEKMQSIIALMVGREAIDFSNLEAVTGKVGQIATPLKNCGEALANL